MSDDSIRCWIYRSPKRTGMYLYLAEEDGFAALPEALQAVFGAPEYVMALALHPGRTLAREEVTQVMAQLRAQGFYLQTPPQQTMLDERAGWIDWGD